MLNSIFFFRVLAGVWRFFGAKTLAIFLLSIFLFEEMSFFFSQDKCEGYEVLF